MGFDQDNVRALNNQGVFPFVASHACVTNDFENIEVFGETWMVEADKGAVAFWGSSDYSYWNEDDLLQRAMFDSLYDAGFGQPSIAAMTDYGLAQVQATYPGSARYYWETYNVLGDPSLQIWIGPRQPDFTLQAEPGRMGVCSLGAASTTVDVSSFMGFTEMVTLDVSGAPAGVVTSFDLNPILPPANSLLTLTDNGALAGNYNLQVVGTAASQVHSIPLALDVFSMVPGQPGVIEPLDGAENQPVRPTFRWTQAHQGQTFEFELASDPAFVQVLKTVEALQSTSYSLDFDLETNSIYYWRVTPQNSCGAGTASTVSSFATEPAPGDCSLGSTTVIHYQADFESGADGWTHGGEGDTWSLSDLRRHSGNNAFYAQDSASVSNQRLVSPFITLPETNSPLSLQFWNYQDIEDRQGGCFDGGILEVSLDGAFWTQLTTQIQNDPYDGPIASTANNPLGGLQAWCGNPQDWAKTVVDVGNLAGETVQFRFRLGTDVSVGYEGWFIDDVQVRTCELGYAARFGLSSQGQTLPGGSVIHPLVLKNLGLADTFTLTLESGVWATTLLSEATITVSERSEVVIPVQVATPRLPGKGVSDRFTLLATSQGKPDQILRVHGDTLVEIAPGVALSPPVQHRLSVPGETVVHTFLITNTGDYTDTFNLSVAGNQWNITAPTNSGWLGPGERGEIELQVKIPLGSSSPEFVIQDVFTLTAASAWMGNTAQAVGHTYGNVTPEVSIQADQVKEGILGSVLRYEFTITNLGNYTDEFTLETHGSWQAWLSQASTGPLAPGESAMVVLFVRIPSEISAGTWDATNLTARSMLDNSVSASAQATSYGRYARVLIPLMRK
jgi:hypothetical protein